MDYRYVSAELKSWKTGSVIEDDDVALLRQAADIIIAYQDFCDYIEKKVRDRQCS